MNILYQRIVLIAGTTMLLLVAGWSSYKTHTLSQKNESIKKDYSAANNISNGLLSVSVWRNQIIEAADYQINHLEFSPGQLDTLELEIAKILHSVINKADTLLDGKSKTLGGKLKKFAAKTLIDEDKIHEKVPEFAQTIAHELLKPQSKQKLKSLVKSKLRQLAKETYDRSKKKNDTTAILKKYNASSVKEFNKKTEALSGQLKQKTYTFTFVSIGVILVFLILWILLRNRKELHNALYVMSILLALEVLLIALITPMIEIDARIKSLDFQLIGQQISFNDQVLFFQSKSIVDVVRILLKTGKYDSILVGILLLAFSIVFPILKLLSTGVYLLADKDWKKNKLVKFFAFKSGKWSMADVTVVAIFMAYIGFKGILDDQLAHLNANTESLSSISTNRTSLQPGYILFIGFVLFGLILSFILEKITPKRQVEQSAVHRQEQKR